MLFRSPVSPELLRDVEDVVIESRYKGSHAQAFLDGHLISDHYFGEHLVWEVALRDWLHRSGKIRLRFAGGSQAHVRVRPVVNRIAQVAWSPAR